MNKCSLSKFVAAQIGDSKRLFCQGILQYAFTALFLAPIPSMTVNAAENTANLTILGPDYPRAFFFRACESGPSNKRMTYEKWAAEFGRLSGIIGKCLDEEVLGREANNPEWFSRFKRDYPNQVVLLHFNGNARDPLYKTEKYFPGHWIYRKATLIISDVPATSGETVIKVENVRDFHVGTGRYRTSNDDIALFGVTPDGKHDWNYCEQVQLISVDQNASTIRVKRGCYGTKPLAFKAGKARAAAHQTEGPWGKNNHLLWFYNFTTHCPRDAEGKTCADRLLDDLAAWFGKGGKLEAFDGIEFDVMFNVTRGDTNGDGEEDNGIIGGTNQYGIGMVEFARQLRKQLGPNRIIQGDGALGPGGVRSQRAFNILNGIESEGWPNIHDWKFDDWANQRIRLKFVADCGPMNNATTDHGFWGDVKIVRANIREEMLTPPKAYMTWLNDRFFASTFYFRKLRSKTVDLTFHIEGSEPVTIQKITAHSHPDAMYRIFENGIVLANPGHSSYAFDLAKLSPGRSYRRLQATAGQDTQANNGENIGATVTLGPLEGLFLLRTDNAK